MIPPVRDDESVKFIETESRMMSAGPWERGKWELFNRYRLLVLRDEKFRRLVAQ